MGSRKILLSMLAFGILLLVWACQTESDITRADLIGTWERPVDILVLNDDGTFRIGAPVGGVDELSYERGQFRFEDRLLTFITGDDSVFCSGQNGSYEVELTEQDELLLTLHEDDCLERRIHFTKPSSGQLEWNRRSP